MTDREASRLERSSADQIEFAGDTPLVIRSADATYGADFLAIMRRLARLPIESIWFGHGDPVLTGGRQVIAQSLAVLESAAALT